MRYNLKQWGAVGAVALILPACVTINIYFPAAAAEKAADKIIDEVWQIKKSQQPADKSSQDKPADTSSMPATNSTAPASP
jgi:hypothetical protein